MCTFPQPLQGCPVTPVPTHSGLVWMLVGALLPPVGLSRGLDA